MAGPFDHLHLKRRTAGSSNELSFDVLDAARDDLDARSARSSRATGAPRPSQGSYHGVGATSTLSAVPEVERRKRARRSRAIRLRVAVGIVVASLLAAAGYAGYRFYEDRVDFTGQFNAIVARFIEVDEVVTTADALMVDPLNSVETDERKAVLGRFDPALLELSDIVAAADALEESPVAPSDEAAFAQLRAAADARSGMIEAAANAFELSEAVNKQMNSAAEAWNKVLTADLDAREAAKMANNASTQEATEQARAKTDEAATLLADARKELSLLAREVEGVGFADELAYIDKRVEALEAADRTSDALLAGDRDGAAAANDAYNEADLAAVALAKKLSVAVTAQVKEHYLDEMQRLIDAYAAARSQAIAADSALRTSLT